jgi:2-oxoglutarate dehydrogenase E1 component
MNTNFPAVSADFVIDLYHQYLRNPDSVDRGWKPFFEEFYGPAGNYTTEPSVRLEAAAARLIEAYRQWGYFTAALEPLSLWAPPAMPDLLPASYGVDEAALDIPVRTPSIYGFECCGTLRELVSHLRAAYAGSIGFDCAHVEDAAARHWLYQLAEQGALRPDDPARRTAGERIVEADEFEQFMNRRFPGKKRFGAEGCEALLPWFDAMLARSAALGVKDVVIGGTARGRLNVMANIIGKPIAMLFYEFKGHRPFPSDVCASGDVPYHFGYLGARSYGDASLMLLYCHNPSHLEAIDGVTSGRVRARQRIYDDQRAGWREVLGVTVHTDAAFAGQGVVAEVLQLSRIPAYRTGGTIRIVINNQVGFTTDPVNGRGSTFCTDVAKTIGAPILHVNGDDIDAVVRCAWIAAEYRHRFNGDVVVDLVCYRRRGHNEVDEPAFTQPMMYQRIQTHPTARQTYIARLVGEDIFAQDEVDSFSRAYFERLDAAYEAADSFRPNRAGSMCIGGATVQNCSIHRATEPPIGLSPERFRTIGLSLSQAPSDVSVNPKIARQLQARESAIKSGEGISWAFAEALAYGSLACEGVEVRVSGQDTPRGAFSQRHFALFDQDSGTIYTPLNHLQPGQARCQIIDSPLSEYAVLGFEYGYSLDAPTGLTVWEAQFGDFANVAQVIVDQFIASAEDKWLDVSGLTLLLPHGQEGQGPDHSSGRIERFLQLCANDNMRVANCSTPANFFHLLRSQARMKPRRPLVVFTPKSLLRHKQLVSRTNEFLSGTCFRSVIGPESGVGAIRRIVVCSGKIYYDLTAKIAERGIADVALVRLEQLYPFPEEALKRELARFPRAEVVWCQEEPQNMGPWSFVDRKIETILREIGSGRQHRCVSRPGNASTTIGTTSEHNADQERLAEMAVAGNK